MTGAVDRYWPTSAAYAVNLSCPDCGVLAWTCPCAVADNDLTGQGDDTRDGLLPYFGPADTEVGSWLE